MRSVGCKKLFFEYYQFLPVIAFMSQVIFFKFLVLTKYHQDLWGISVNLTIISDCLQLILLQTLTQGSEKEFFYFWFNTAFVQDKKFCTEKIWTIHINPKPGNIFTRISLLKWVFKHFADTT